MNDKPEVLSFGTGSEELWAKLDTRKRDVSAFTEDVAAARALIAGSKDIILSAEQTGYVWFHRGLELYSVKFMPAVRQNRAVESIKKRAKLIIKSGTYFAVCLVCIVWANPSGANQEEYVKLATAI